MKESGITGIIGTEKVDKIISKKEPIDQTFHIMNLERCIYPIDYSRSKIIFGKENPKMKCELCNPKGRTKNFILGLYFDSDVKVNFDIFRIYDMGDAVFLSERFIKICNECNLTGLQYENITEYNTAKGIFSEQEISELLKKN